MANTRAKTAAARDRDARSSTRDDREYVDELTHVSPSVRARRRRRRRRRRRACER